MCKIYVKILYLDDFHSLDEAIGEAKCYIRDYFLRGYVLHVRIISRTSSRCIKIVKDEKEFD